MKQIKLAAVILGVSFAFVVTAFTAFANPNLARSDEAAAAPAQAEVEAPLAACSKMKGSAVAWVTLDEDGDIDEEVESYPSGVNTITPVFEYNCVPKKASLVTVFTLDGETVFSDKESLKATDRDGLYGYPLGTTDESPLPEGLWGVEFYNSKTLLTAGEVSVGEGSGDTPSTSVTVEGVVKDKKTKKPIKGAVILVLEPGITIEKFVDGGQKKKDVYTAGQTDSKGQFVLEDQLERNVEYSVIVTAKGYKPTGGDEFVITDDDPDPLELTVTMSK
jgi:hypothetical protein